MCFGFVFIKQIDIYDYVSFLHITYRINKIPFSALTFTEKHNPSNNSLPITHAHVSGGPPSHFIHACPTLVNIIYFN